MDITTTHNIKILLFNGVFIQAPGINEILLPDIKILGQLCDPDRTVVVVQYKNMIATCFHPELTDDLYDVLVCVALFSFWVLEELSDILCLDIRQLENVSVTVTICLVKS